VDRIRVLPARLPDMMLDALKRVEEAEPDIEVVEETGVGVDLLVAAGQTRTDIVVMGLAGSAFPGICSHLLAEYPHLKILGISAADHRGFLYELRTHEAALGEITPHNLLAKIRTAVGNSGT
jgi:DNA-binding NarL/FixJ family response regulator